MKFRWCIPILFLLAAPLFAEEGMVLKPKQEPPQVNAILASVNGVPISLMDILNTTRNSEYQAYAVFSGKRLEEEIRKIRLKAVNDRIDKLLVLEEFRENPFPIPNQAVEEELDNIAERMGVRSRSEFTRRLRQSGTTIEDLRKEVEEYIILQMMIFDQRSEFMSKGTKLPFTFAFISTPQPITRRRSTIISLLKILSYVLFWQFSVLPRTGIIA